MSAYPLDSGRGGEADAPRAQDPSMEEILASIRAIIADDRANAAAARGADPAAARPADPARPSPAGGSQVIYSTFGQKTPGMPPPIPARPERPTIAAQPEAIPEPEFSPEEEEPEAPLLSAEADREIATSFQALSASLTGPDPQKIEAMTRDLLRSMLKSWLDENLPALVERLVKAEIQRVARGGR